MNETYAFPSDINLGDSVDEANWTKSGGMTLRDYFAAKAIHPIMLLGEARKDANDCEYYASHAYMMADAMMKVRAE
jgi:beta-glucanase (GH16 family)